MDLKPVNIQGTINYLYKYSKWHLNTTLLTPQQQKKVF